MSKLEAASEPASDPPIEARPDTTSTLSNVASPPIAKRLDDAEGRELYERWSAIQQEIGRLDTALEDAEEAYKVALSEPVTAGDLDGRVHSLTELELRVNELRATRSAEQHRFMLVDELLLPYRQRARGRAQEEKRKQITEIEREDEALNVEIATHLNAVEKLKREREVLNRRTEPLIRQIDGLALRTDKVILVNLHRAHAWRPPSDVLMRASSWRLFFERARTAGLESAQIVVNEVNGLIVKAPFDL